MNVSLVIVAAVLLSVAAPGALAQPQWKYVGSLGQRQLVVVEASAATDTDLLKQAAAVTCVPDQPCVVAFWSDAAAVPSVMPMSAAQQQAIVAQYLRNPKSGIEELLLKCGSGNSSSGKCLH